MLRATLDGMGCLGAETAAPAIKQIATA